MRINARAAVPAPKTACSTTFPLQTADLFGAKTAPTAWRASANAPPKRLNTAKKASVREDTVAESMKNNFLKEFKNLESKSLVLNN